MAKTWGCRPSAILDIRDPYLAYQVDEVVLVTGLEIESVLDRIEGKTAAEADAKRQAALEALLGGRRFADPQAFGKPIKRAEDAGI